MLSSLQLAQKTVPEQCLGKQSYRYVFWEMPGSDISQGLLMTLFFYLLFFLCFVNFLVITLSKPDQPALDLQKTNEEPHGLGGVYL